LQRFTYVFIVSFYLGFINTCARIAKDKRLIKKFSVEDFGENQYFSENSFIGKYIKSINFDVSNNKDLY
jgi:hypothetical protein